MCCLHWGGLSEIGLQQKTWNDERKSSDRNETSEITLCPLANNTQGKTFWSIIFINIDYENSGPYH